MEGYMGSIMMCAFSFNPMNFAACNGATVLIQQNSALFALLGTQFGGNGTTNFMLPDLQGRAPVHFGVASGGSTNRVMAGKFGAETVTITTAQLPAHNHALGEAQAGQTVTATAAATVNANNTAATLAGPANHYWAIPAVGTTTSFGYNSTKVVTMASDAVTVAVNPTFNKANLTIGATGNGAALPVATPSLALNFCICTAGIFPSRT